MVAITSQTMADEIARQQRLARSIADDQASISSGKKLSTPSQDPQAWVQVSEIGRSQAQQAAWTANANYGQARANKASSNLNEMNTLFSRARELMVNASSNSMDPAGKAATIADLQGIRASLSDLLNEKDYQGTPVFDDTNPTQVPVSRGLALDVVGTRQSIESGVTVGATTTSLDAILVGAINAVTSGVPADIQNSLTAVEAGLNHVIINQSVQGIRSDRLSAATDRLSDTSLSLSERRSKLEDTDLTTTLAGLQSKLLTLEAAQSAFARINRQSLWDLIS
ncbi:flagellin [Sphingobium subterraneum]|uniref:Flagellin n=1 Tax=Sphingobium subterraneum TaxID=627688 RepID=A0A841J5J9_9SPHN|nr:flagellin [Sphingobium subterraneum]MBB6123818.1 flagellar hook-associated protein 3 FlgL [Sphingobium subterraneum]